MIIRRKPRLLLLLLLITISSQLTAQLVDRNDKGFIKQINVADGFFIYDEDYHKASKIYEELIKLDSSNHNISYKLGVCYLNIRGYERLSLPLLRYASESYVDEMSYSTIGEKAPFDVLYYLGFSCQINMELDEAIEYYQQYKKRLKVGEATEIDYVNNQIKACRNTIEATKNGMFLKKKLLAPWFTSYMNSVNPVISNNDSVLVFTILSPDGNRIFCSRRDFSGWGEPEDISSELGKFYDMFTNSLTSNGSSLIISRNDGFKGNLYISRYKKGKWQRIEKLGKNINTRYWESHGSISRDGSELYFSSNRPGGYGSLDIYHSVLQKNNEFGPAINLGPVVNSSLEENTPFLNEPSETLFFSSTGHEGFGGYDIFFSTKGKNWSEPVHLPFPLNTTSDDLHYYPYTPDNSGLLSSYAFDNQLQSTIYHITHSIKVQHDMFLARGNISLGDGMLVESDKLSIEFYSGNPENPSDMVSPDSAGYFTFEMDLSRYSVYISYPGYKSDTVDIDIRESFVGSSISINRNLIPESVVSGEFLSVKNILFAFDSYNLDRDAQIELEKFIPIIMNNEDLQIEIKGYTDPIGAEDYNIQLSRRRADTVLKYLKEAGINPERLFPIAKGETDFVSNNYNKDGSDNPDGRKFNRRVSLSIRNNGYSIVLGSNRFIPRHLRNFNLPSYYLVIKESETQLSPDYFNSHQISEFSLVKEINDSGIYKYLIGDFLTKSDAQNFQLTVRDFGFENSYIVDNYEIERSPDGEKSKNQIYTIQLHALLNPSKDDIKDLPNVRVFKGRDGFYRYIVGEYNGYARAKEALKMIVKKGYTEAYIKEFSVLQKQSENKE